MKLSFSTLGCPEWSYEQVIDAAAKNGFEGVEIRGVAGEMRPDKIGCFLPENRKAALALAKEKGVKLIGFGTSSAFHDQNAFDRSIEEGKTAIALAADTGMGFIRVFGDTVNPSANEEEVINRVVKGIKTLCEAAQGTGVQVLMEIHGNFNIARRVVSVCEGVDRPEFGLVYDVAHVDRGNGDGWETFYDAVKPWIRHVHFKDHRRSAGRWVLCNTGEGDIPLKAIRDRLEADGYDGYISLEWEKAWHQELRSAAEEFPHFMHYIRTV